MLGVVNLVRKDEKGNVVIPYDRVSYEQEKFKSNGQVTMLYVFDDGSSVEVIYTKDKDYIMKRESAKVENI